MLLLTSCSFFASYKKGLELSKSQLELSKSQKDAELDFGIEAGYSGSFSIKGFFQHLKWEVGYEYNKLKGTMFPTDDALGFHNAFFGLGAYPLKTRLQPFIGGRGKYGYANSDLYKGTSQKSSSYRALSYSGIAGLNFYISRKFALTGKAEFGKTFFTYKDPNATTSKTASIQVETINKDLKPFESKSFFVGILFNF